VQEDVVGLGGDEDEDEDAGGSKVVRGVSGESCAISGSPIYLTSCKMPLDTTRNFHPHSRWTSACSTPVILSEAHPSVVVLRM
jgi:hypothetical protein